MQYRPGSSTSDGSSAPGVEFTRYDAEFLEFSWTWLNDPEIKRLTMTPDFSREQQRKWFSSLGDQPDYRIWGVKFRGKPVGAVGLKHIADGRGEYWGYLGDRDSWGKGVGAEMIAFIFAVARDLRLKNIYLKVTAENLRAVRLYERLGFSVHCEENGVVTMECPT